jgi:hypothetical protein
VDDAAFQQALARASNEGAVIARGEHITRDQLEELLLEASALGLNLVDFRNATFTDEVSFLDITFREADFRNVTFQKGVTFYQTTFEEVTRSPIAAVDFSDATFTHDARFIHTTFMSSSSFDRAEFMHDAFFTTRCLSPSPSSVTAPPRAGMTPACKPRAGWTRQTSHPMQGRSPRSTARYARALRTTATSPGPPTSTTASNDVGRGQIASLAHAYVRRKRGCR